MLGSPLCRAVTPAEKRLVAHNWQCPPVLQQEQPEPLSRSEEAFKQSMNFKRLDENVSKYIALRCLISAAFTGGRNLCVLCKRWRQHLLQLPNPLVTETCRSLHFWLAAEVRKDNSSTVLGLVLL